MESSEAPEEVGQRKADLRQCARWIVAALQQERQARRQLHDQLTTAEARAAAAEATAEEAREAATAAAAVARLRSEQLVGKEAQLAGKEELLLLRDEEVGRLREEVAHARTETEEARREAQRLAEDVRRLRDHLVAAGDAGDEEAEGLRQRLEEAQLQAAAAAADCQQLAADAQVAAADAEAARAAARAAEERCREVRAAKQAHDERVRRLFEQREVTVTRLRAQVTALSAEVLRLRTTASPTAAAPPSLQPPPPTHTTHTTAADGDGGNGGGDGGGGDGVAEAAVAATWDACGEAQENAAALESYALRRRAAAYRLAGRSGEEAVGGGASGGLRLPPALAEVLRAGGGARLAASEAAVAAVLEGVAAGGAAAERAYPALTALLLATEPARLQRLVEDALTEDVARTVAQGDVNTLFRCNSAGTKLLSAVTRQTGAPLLAATVGRVLRNEAGLARVYELDPTRLARGAVASLHADNLRQLCQALLDAIIGAHDALPPPMAHLTAFLGTAVAHAFPAAPHLGIVNMMFLRFFCVAIAAPATFGLLDGVQMTADLQRGLLLASKVVQNLANGATFKEGFMVVMNDWVEASGPPLHSYFQALAQAPQQQLQQPQSSAALVRSLREAFAAAMAPARTCVVAALRASDVGSEVRRETVRMEVRVALRCLLDTLVSPAGANGDDEAAAAHTFLALLCSSDALLAAVVEALHAAKGPALEAAVAALATAFLHEGRGAALLCFVADVEADLLGDLSHSSLLQTVARRMVALSGRSFLRAVVGQLVDDVVADDLQFEIDGDRMEGAHEDLLLRNAQSLTDLAAKAVRSLPKLLRSCLGGDLREGLRFAAAEKQQLVAPLLVGGILAPAITDPVAFGVLDDVPSSAVRRTLSLLGDILAKLAKEALFYQKGTAYAAVDEFIMRNTTAFRQGVQKAVLDAHHETSAAEELISWTDAEASVRQLADVLARKQDFLESYVGTEKAVLCFEWTLADLAEVVCV